MDGLVASFSEELGRVWMGMRKYGWLYIAIPERAGKWARHRYELAIMSAIETAWRC